MILLHRVRIALYFCTLFLPLLHPAVSFPASWPILWRLFAVLPGAALIAFGLSRAASDKPKSAATLPIFATAATLLIGSLVLDGFGLAGLRTLLLGLAVFLLSLAIYSRKPLLPALLEPLAWAWAAFRILGFSGASVELAQASRSVFPFLSAVAAGGLLLTLWAVTRARAELGTEGWGTRAAKGTDAVASGTQSSRRPRRASKTAVWAGLTAAVLALAYLAGLAALPRVVPPEPFENPLAEALRPEPKAIPGSAEGGDPDGNLQGDEAGLYEAPAREWGSGEAGRQSQPGQQSLVMVAESARSRAYLAQYYFVDIDPREGFRIDRDEPLNRLPGDRYLETWTNTVLNAGRPRTPQWTRIWSVTPERAAPYWPYLLEPAVRDDRYAPLSYSYRVLSLFSTAGPDQVPSFLLPYARDELREFARFLEVPLSLADAEHFRRHLNSFVDPSASLPEKISGLLRSFSQFQYKAGFTDDLRISALTSFMTDTQTGDCSEFSNAAAILARLAGIPSRVVTGYILSDHLQTDAHRRGIAELRSQIPGLAAADPSQLYLISDVHRHSWVQFYLPQYGWVDFETTSYAIPPEGEDDPNSLALVIPEIQPRPGPSSLRFFGDFLQALAFLGLSAAILWYCRRWALLLRLQITARRPGQTGTRALERLLLIVVSTRGRPAKLPSQTLNEYAALAPEIEGFARIFTAARYRTDPESLARAYPALAAEYLRIVEAGQSLFGWYRMVLRPWDGGLL